VHHGPVPFEHPDARFQQRAVSGPRDGLHDADIRTLSGNQKADVHTIESRRPQGLDVGRGPGKIGIGKPQSLIGQGRNQGVQTVGTGAERRISHDPQSHVTNFRDGFGVGQFLIRNGSARFRPDFRKGLGHLGHRGTSQFHTRITPGIDALSGIPNPHPAHTEPADKSNAIIHDDRFAMITVEPAQRVAGPGWIETPHFNPC